MDALTALHTRTSAPRLSHPAPPDAVLENIYQAALRAPDHGRLRPWRFVVVSGEGLDKLGRLFADVASADDPGLSQAEREAAYAKAQRAPVIVVAVATVQKHPKVPRLEQLMSTAAAVQNMSVATFAQGYGAVWRTGPLAYHPLVREAFGVSGEDEIVGFLYVGTVERQNRVDDRLFVRDFFSDWV